MITGMPKDLAAILAVDQNYGIGYKNNILIKNSIDMSLFRKYTLAYKNCIVGNKTAQSLNYHLKDRILHVMSRSRPALELDVNVPYIVIGGNEIYDYFKNSITTWYVTYFKQSCLNVDTYLNEDVINVINSIKTQEIIFENEDLVVIKYVKI